MHFDFGAGLGLAAQFFVLISTVKTADISARFRLSAFGSRIGGGSAGWAIPGISDWSDLGGKRPFSAQNLHQCAATVVTATVGAGANVGPCLISAITPTGTPLRGSGRSGAFRWSKHRSLRVRWYVEIHQSGSQPAGNPRRCLCGLIPSSDQDLCSPDLTLVPGTERGTESPARQEQVFTQRKPSSSSQAHSINKHPVFVRLA
jgi:hypothetical protein